MADMIFKLIRLRHDAAAVKKGPEAVKKRLAYRIGHKLLRKLLH